MERVRGAAGERIRVEASGNFHVFTIAVVVFALTFIVAGRLQDKFGPFWVSLTGGVLVSLGFFLCSYTTA